MVGQSTGDGRSAGDGGSHRSGRTRGRENGDGAPDGDAAPATFADAWVRASGHVANSVVEANRAALAAFGLGNGALGPEADATGGPGDGTGRTVGSSVPDAADAGVPSVAYRGTDWETELHVDSPGELRVGDGVRFSKRLTEADVRAFAGASGDTNRLHLDDAFAADSRFGGRIVHGTLVSGIVSAALARLPGLTIYLSQEVTFLGPVAIGERVTAEVEVLEVLGDDRYRLATDVLDEEGEAVVAGEATVIVDELPGGESAAEPEPDR